MSDIEALRSKLRKRVAREKIAMTRLRRAQTLFDKAYAARLRTQELVHEAEDLIDSATARLLGKEGR